jgi:hypothetical protein
MKNTPCQATWIREELPHLLPVSGTVYALV